MDQQHAYGSFVVSYERFIIGLRDADGLVKRAGGMRYVLAREAPAPYSVDRE